MSIYIIILIIILISALFRSKKLQAVFCGMLLFCIAGFRSTSVGIDLINYIPLFNTISNLPLKDIQNSHYEYGYVLFNKIAGLINKDERFFILITSAFIILYISKYIYENSKIPWLSFFLFVTLMYFGSSFNLIRQSMAMVITLNSIKFVEKRNFKRFMICIFIAVLFHKTAIFFILIYLISKFKINYKYIFSIVIFSFFIILFGTSVVEFLVNFIDSYRFMYSNSIIEGNGYSMLALLIGVTLLGFLFGKYKYCKEDNLQIYYHIMILAIFSQLIAVRFSLFTRVTNYFSIGMIIFIPNVIENLHEKHIRYFGIICVCILTMIFYIYNLKINLDGIVPYYFM